MRSIFEFAERLTRRKTVDDLRPAVAEQQLSDYWTLYKAAGQRFDSFILAHPILFYRAVRNVWRLPIVEAVLSNHRQGRIIADALRRRLVRDTLTIAETGACILEIPNLPEAYSQGSHRQTLRRKSRAALAAGITWRAVTERSEQTDLVTILERALARKADARYRQLDVAHDHLIDSGMWTVAFSASGDPLLIAVTPCDGKWALLSAFLTLGDDKQHSDARYLMTQVVVERLSAIGVRYLVDTRSPFELENGLRHFQRMLGYRIARVRVIEDRAGVCRPLPHLRILQRLMKTTG